MYLISELVKYLLPNTKSRKHVELDNTNNQGSRYICNPSIKNKKHLRSGPLETYPHWPVMLCLGNTGVKFNMGQISKASKEFLTLQNFAACPPYYVRPICYYIMYVVCCIMYVGFTTLGTFCSSYGRTIPKNDFNQSHLCLCMYCIKK